MNPYDELERITKERQRIEIIVGTMFAEARGIHRETAAMLNELEADIELREAGGEDVQEAKALLRSFRLKHRKLREAMDTSTSRETREAATRLDESENESIH